MEERLGGMWQWMMTGEVLSVLLSWREMGVMEQMKLRLRRLKGGEGTLRGAKFARVHREKGQLVS